MPGRQGGGGHATSRPATPTSIRGTNCAPHGGALTIPMPWQGPQIALLKPLQQKPWQRCEDRSALATMRTHRVQNHTECKLRPSSLVTARPDHCPKPLRRATPFKLVLVLNFERSCFIHCHPASQGGGLESFGAPPILDRRQTAGVIVLPLGEPVRWSEAVNTKMARTQVRRSADLKLEVGLKGLCRVSWVFGDLGHMKARGSCINIIKLPLSLWRFPAAAWPPAQILSASAGKLWDRH